MTRRPLAALVAAACLYVPAAMAADPATIVDKECSACHGRNGASTEPNIPIIGGYSAKYLAESIRSFRKKIRMCAEVTIPTGPKKGTKSDMCKVSNALSESDIDAVSKYLSTQRFVRAKQAFDPAKAQRGVAVYKLRCEKCHENNGASPEEDNGILAGQWMTYMREQLAGFRSGRRPLDDKMKQRLDKVTKEDEEALLHFFASQQ